MLDDDRRRGVAPERAIGTKTRVTTWVALDPKLEELGESRPRIRAFVQRLRGVPVVPAPDSAPRTLALAVDHLEAEGLDLFHADMDPAPTPKEEEMLFRRLDFARVRLQDAIRREMRKEIEGRADELQEVTDEIVLRNLRLVIWVLRQSRRVGVPRPDLLQEGILGLLEAVRRYDRRRKTRFATYAVWWIRQAIHRGFHRHQDIVHIPEHIRRRQTRLLKERGAEAMNPSDVAKTLGLPESVIPIVLRSRGLSLDDPGPDWDDEPYLEPEADDELLDGVRNREVRELIDAALGDLPERRARIVRRRLGLDGRPPQTLQSLGRDLGLTAEGVRQIYYKALRDIRESGV